jgi:uncharacterized protein
MTKRSFPAGVRLATLLMRNCFSWLRLLACALLAACVANAAACPLQAAATSHVTDAGGLLGQRAGEIGASLAAYQAASGHQLFLLVVPSLDAGISIEECAVAVFNKWKIGRAKVDDGVLLLIAVREKRVRIEVGYGLEGVLTDAQSSRIIQERMKPLLAQGDYAAASVSGLGAIMALLGAPASTPAPQLERSNEILVVAVLQAFCTTILLLALATSPLAGIAGLFLISAPVAGFAYWVYPDWRAYLFAALCAVAWCAIRVRLIRANVKKYHLKKSRNKALTWIWRFIAIGDASPPRKRRGPAFEVSFDFCSSSGSDSGSGDSQGGGGRSGGGGASGSW